MSETQQRRKEEPMIRTQVHFTEDTKIEAKVIDFTDRDGPFYCVKIGEVDLFVTLEIWAQFQKAVIHALRNPVKA
jgi:hypothetical protein